MACIINASTSAGLVQTADLSGVLQFQQNGVALPNGGVAPAFSAYGSVDQNFTSGVSTKITLDTETFDTNSNFASSRFTPTVAGYYQINATVRINDTVSLTNGQALIYKNGSQYVSGTLTLSGLTIAVVSTLVYLNGSTDYIELYGYGVGTAPFFDFVNTGSCCVMSGSLVRGA